MRYKGRNQHVNSNKISIVMTKNVTIGLHFPKSKKKKKHHMAHLKCHLLKTVQTLTETPSCLRACTYGMELCHMLKH